MDRWIVDGTGNFCPLMQLHAAWRSDLTPQQLARYAVDNLGYVAIVDRPSALYVAPRPRAVSQATLVGALVSPWGKLINPNGW